MTSRWAFEALAVEQFKNNKYQKEFFPLDQAISTKNYYVSFLIPELETKVNQALQYINQETNREGTRQDLELLKYQIADLNTQFPNLPYDSIRHLDLAFFNDAVAVNVNRYLESLRSQLRQQMKEAKQAKSLKEKQLIEKAGGIIAYSAFRNENYNSKLADILLNRNLANKIIEVDHKLIRKDTPVFMEPTSTIGRAQLYSPVKRLGNLTIDTIWFNVAFIWFTIFLSYLALYFDVLRKVLTTFETIKLRSGS